MLAVLEAERQALAGLDLAAVLGTSNEKGRLCNALEAADPASIDEESRAMLDTARRLNEVNRQVRNLVAANVASRLDALGGAAPVYKPNASYALAGRPA
jgi:predicted transcriptional regulator